MAGAAHRAVCWHGRLRREKLQRARTSPGRGSEKDRIEATTMTRWERSVPVYGVPVLNRGFWGLLIVVVVGFLLAGFREVVGLGSGVSGMSDPFAWGLWKNFNVMVLTG